MKISFESKMLSTSFETNINLKPAANAGATATKATLQFIGKLGRGIRAAGQAAAKEIAAK